MDQNSRQLEAIKINKDEDRTSDHKIRYTRVADGRDEKTALCESPLRCDEIGNV